MVERAFHTKEIKEGIDVSTPDIQESTSQAAGEDTEIREQREWHRQAFGIVLGLALAALVYFIFPENAPETVMQSTGADPE